MRRRLCLCLLLALWFATPALAAKVETVKLGDDVAVWYVRDGAVPVVDLRLSFAAAGEAYAPKGEEGLAAYAAAMLGQGAGDMDAAAFARALDAKAISLSFDADEDQLTVHLYALRDHAAEAARLLILALTKPPLAEADRARVAMQMESARQMRAENPGYLASRQLATRAFAGHPYARAVEGEAGAPIVWNEAALRAYYGRALTRRALTITAAGDVDSALLKTMLAPLIEALPEGDAVATLAPATLAGVGEVLRTQKPIPQTVVRFAAPAVARSDPRFYAAFLLNEILGGGTLTSRLGDALRQQKGLVYSIGSGLDVRDGVALITGQLATRNETADAAVAATKEVLARTAREGVTREECEDAKRYAIGHFPLQLETSGDVASTLMMMRRYQLGQDYMEQRRALFERVTCADINEVARELLAPERFLFSVVGGGTQDKGAPAPTQAPAHGDVR